jgi:hypothetical protein
MQGRREEGHVGKRLHGRPRYRWTDYTKMDLRDRGWFGGADQIHLTQDKDRWQALMNTTMNLCISYKMILLTSSLHC